MNPPDDQCIICLGNTTSELYPYPCRHRYCFVCLDFWTEKNSSCPQCREHAVLRLARCQVCKHEYAYYQMRFYFDCNHMLCSGCAATTEACSVAVECTNPPPTTRSGRKCTTTKVATYCGAERNAKVALVKQDCKTYRPDKTPQIIEYISVTTKLKWENDLAAAAAAAAAVAKRRKLHAL